MVMKDISRHRFSRNLRFSAAGFRLLLPFVFTFICAMEGAAQFEFDEPWPPAIEALPVEGSFSSGETVELSLKVSPEAGIHVYRDKIKAAFEAMDAGVKLLVMVPEHVPVHDTMAIVERAAQQGVQVVGPNTPGLICPRVGCKIGFLPQRLSDKLPLNLQDCLDERLVLQLFVWHGLSSRSTVRRAMLPLMSIGGASQQLTELLPLWQHSGDHMKVGVCLRELSLLSPVLAKRTGIVLPQDASSDEDPEDTPPIDAVAEAIDTWLRDYAETD